MYVERNIVTHLHKHCCNEHPVFVIWCEQHTNLISHKLPLWGIRVAIEDKMY